MKVHLVDGTYELFRAFYGAPSKTGAKGREVGGTCALMRSLMYLCSDREVTHVACAFDHVIESFRNDLYAGYKTGAGIDPALYGQFELAERATRALGLVAWPMIEHEADDALATFAARCVDDPQVEQVVIASPDKDLTQCVQGERVVCWDRMRKKVLDEPGVVAKFGVGPSSIPDWLALVGDSADGYPGITRWGARSAATVLARYQHLEQIPDDPRSWEVAVRGAAALAASLAAARGEAMLYRELAILRRDSPLTESLADLAWQGPRLAELEALARELDDDRIVELAQRTFAERT
ncbi:MAG TPA: 5'-3' exonuclease H3TH domain-containing protein [Polyangiales bacterium]|nr:5'-3' exonuclease H3TH domain-containing protein [Polyangiales bacterium]